MINWIKRWIERQRSRRVVPWESCAMNVPVWRKKKAEEQYVKQMTEHHMTMFRIQMDANMRKIERQYADNKRFLAKIRQKVLRPARWTNP